MLRLRQQVVIIFLPFRGKRGPSGRLVHGLEFEAPTPGMAEAKHAMMIDDDADDRYLVA
jgi:hypothetical protein